MEKSEERVKGWEVAQELEKQKTWQERLMPGKSQIVGALWGLAALFVVFLISCWLATNPFEATQRIVSEPIKAMGYTGDTWGLIWYVIVLAFVFEFMDASAGMGYGTALTPILFVMGFEPLQVVPVIMIQQCTAGLVGTFLHREFENVVWKFKPMSETIRVWLIIAILGCLAVAFSITAVYGYLSVAKVWIKVYVALLLAAMGIIAIWQTTGKKEKPYKPKRLFIFAALAGFNKGIGGGGYGPVVTVGGRLAGIPAKTQLAVTAISEGTVSGFALIVWILMLAGGTTIDYILLPSMMIATVASAVIAPFTIRVVSEKVWRWVIPFYCCVIVVICFYKIGPSVLAKISG